MASSLSSLFAAHSAHIGTGSEWKARAKRYGARTAAGAAKAHARQHGAAYFLHADDSVSLFMLDHESGAIRCHKESA